MASASFTGADALRARAPVDDDPAGGDQVGRLPARARQPPGDQGGVEPLARSRQRRQRRLLGRVQRLLDHVEHGGDVVVVGVDVVGEGELRQGCIDGGVPGDGQRGER